MKPLEREHPTLHTSAAYGTSRKASVRRSVVIGLLDQSLVALANAGNAFLCTVLLPRDSAGTVLISIATIQFVLGLGRAFIGEVLLTHVSRCDGEDRRAREQDALAAALAAGFVSALFLSLLWGLGPKQWFVDLVWILPFVPMLMLHDTGRYSLLAAGRQDRALVLDFVWVAAQVGVVMCALLMGLRTGGTILLAWGLGTAAAAVFYMSQGGLRPWRGSCRVWMEQTGHLSKWFTATALVGQTQVLLVALIVSSLLSESAYAGLRLMQLVILQPVLNFVTAINALLVPAVSSLAARGEVSEIRDRVRKLMLLGLLLGCSGVLLSVPIAEPVLTWYQSGAYRDVASLAVPVSIQATIYLVQIPCIAALRGLQRADLLLVQYLVFSAATLACVVLGARTGSLVHASYGLLCGAAVGFGVTLILYRRAVLQDRAWSVP